MQNRIQGFGPSPSKAAWSVTDSAGILEPQDAFDLSDLASRLAAVAPEDVSRVIVGTTRSEQGQWVQVSLAGPKGAVLLDEASDVRGAIDVLLTYADAWTMAA